MMGASGTRGDLHSDISVTNLGGSPKTLADGAVSFPGNKKASYSMVGSKSNGGVGGMEAQVSTLLWDITAARDASSSQESGKSQWLPLVSTMAQIVRNHWGKAEPLTNV